MAEIGLVTKYDNSELIKGLEKELELQEKLLDISGDAGKELAESVKEASAELTKANQAFDNSAKKIQNAAKESERAAGATKQLTANLKGAVKEFRVFGVSIGDVQEKLAGANKGFGSFSALLKSTPGLLNKLKIALVATGIGAFVVLLGSLVAAFTRTQKGIDTVNQALAAVGSVVGNVVDRFSTLGNALIGFVTGTKSLSEAAGEAAGAFQNIAEFAEDANAAIQLEAASQKLRDDQRALRLEYEKSLATISELSLVADDTNRSQQERIDALQRAQELENNIESQRLALAGENLRIIQERNTLSESFAADLDAEAEAEANLAQIRKESVDRQREFLTRRQAIENEVLAKIKEQQEEARKLAEEQQKALETFEKELAAFEDSVDAIRRSELTSEERIEAEKNLTIEKIKEEQKRLEATAAALGREVDLTEEFNILIAEAERKAAEELFNLEREQQEKSKAALQKFLDERLDIIRRDDEGNVISLQFDELGQVFSPELAAQAQQQTDDFIFDLTSSIRENAEDQLQDDDLNFLDRFVEGVKEKLNLSDEDFSAIADSFGQIQNAIAGIFQGSIERQLAVQDELIKASRERIEELERDLDRETQLAEQGKANSLEIVQEQIEEERALIEAAEAEKRKIQEAALRAQLISDSLQQASALAVAGAEIFKANAGIPVVGIVSAIAAVATLIAAFTRFKSQVESLTTLHTGGALADHVSESSGLLKGPTDKPGQGRGMRIEGTNIIVGGNEFVMKEEQTLSNLPFLNAMNQGRYKEVDLFSLAESARMAAARYTSPVGEKARAVTARERSAPVVQNDRNTLDRKAMKEIMKQAVEDTIKGFGREINKDVKLLPILGNKGATIGYVQRSGNNTRRVMF